MRVELNRINKNYHFKGEGVSSIAINIDGSPDIGGENAGARPMELILMGLGSCSAIDIVRILKKQKQLLKEFNIHIDAERENQIPAVFKTIDIHFILKGELEEKKVEKAIELSMTKYCSVTAMLEKTVKINYSFSIN
jgi:putative redox protein